MKTTTYIVFGKNGLEIRNDISSFSCNHFDTPSDFTDFETGASMAQTYPYATYEPRYWLLDGNYKFFPETPSDAHIGWMSDNLSGDSGAFNFSSEPELTIIFDEVHSTNGLKFYFAVPSFDYIDSLRVRFYDASDVLIDDTTYAPNLHTFETGDPISDFKKIIITMKSTNKASRRGRISLIEFDELTTFDDEVISEASLVEQINPVANELPINSLEFKLFSPDGDFSVTDPAASYASFQYKDPVDVYEQVDLSMVFIGRFYLDRWESLSANEASFEASDPLGLLEKPLYYGGLWGPFGSALLNSGAPVDASVLIEDIMSVTGLPYELDASLNSIDVEGWIPIVSCREALQLVCMAIGAYITCARSNKILIRPIELASDLSTYDYTLTSQEKHIDSPVQLRQLVTGVEVTSHEYRDGDAIKTFFEGNLSLGNHTIFFNEPSNGMSATGDVDQITLDTNWELIDVNTAGVILLESQGYNDSLEMKAMYNGSLPANTPENILVVDECTLITPTNVATVLERIYDYYQQRYLQKTELYGSLIKVGDSVLCETLSGKYILGIVEKANTDLSGGFVSKIDIIGVLFVP